MKQDVPYGTPGASEDREPDPVVPVRAADWPDVRGQRVIMGEARLGWRSDLRADSCVTQGGRVYVPVLTEHDWYRAEAEQIEVFAPLVPASRVWVETTTRDELPDAGSPGVRRPIPADAKSKVRGHRVVCLAPEFPYRFQRALRAASDVTRTPDGRCVILVVKEVDWYRWAWTGRMPTPVELPADHVWIE